MDRHSHKPLPPPVVHRLARPSSPAPVCRVVRAICSPLLQVSPRILYLQSNPSPSELPIEVPSACRPEPWISRSQRRNRIMSTNESGDAGSGSSGSSRTKKALVGAGARILFYPTLVYNVVRNKMQAEFRWWDEIDQFVLLGAVPFPKDVPLLRQIGVRGVVTLNEPYETLVPSKLYKAHGIDHLVIPTRDYLFAPSLSNIRRAVDFIHSKDFSSSLLPYCWHIHMFHCKMHLQIDMAAGAVDINQSYNRKICSRYLLFLVSTLYIRIGQAVQEFSRGKLEHSASQSSDMSDGIIVTEDDIKGYSDVDDNFRRTSSCSARPGREAPPTADDPADSNVVTDAGFEWNPRHSLSCPSGSDEVFITEADIEGYNEFMDNCNDKSKAPNQNKITGAVMRKLSCLFFSFMSFAGSLSVASGLLAVCAI
ncbi:hypothetical protein B296_00046532 [Ensete ventricosum]|uniref:Dual specificity protein phosphatase DSP8 n=1 Tax=Ensete ventricosum TaxID=4639 RepID=A0A426Z3J7_ENSVE|nr:hypothetical protein B296_00046532 [Ensete ventricosum]